MSHSHNSRRKTIKKFKKQFGAKWSSEFRKRADEIRRNIDGPLIGSLADIIDFKK